MTAKFMTLLLIVFSLVGLAVSPVGVLQTVAFAQVDVDADTLTQEITDEVDQEIEQEAEQEAEQEQEQEQSNEQSAEQDNAADVSQDESNEQANVLETGDNTASTTQVGDNDAIGNEVEAESEGGNAGDAKAKKDSEASSEGGDSGDASASLEQSVENEATTIQDSSADGNVLANENTFGDDIAIVDQENIAEQNAANVGVQEQDLTQTIDQIQEAANTNLDFDVQVGIQQPPPGAEPPGAEPECPPGFTFNPDIDLCEGATQTAAPICTIGTFNPDTDLCEGTQIFSPCPAGLFFNGTACLGPPGTTSFRQLCPEGTTTFFNPVPGEESHCERTVTAPPECQPGFRFNPATNQCERTVTRPPT